jgi:hypothetical protein
MFCDPTSPGLAPEVREFYCNAMKHLNESGIEFLVGGAYALAQYTPIERHTRDFDIFLRKKDCQRAMDALEKAGYRTELTFPHWLGKAYYHGNYIDLIYSSGNGVCDVDDDWFRYASDGIVLDMPAKLVPMVEMIWSKTFIMERERFDGADVLHVIHAAADQLDWDRLVSRMGSAWRVLLSHLILFGFVYPGQRSRVPERVMKELMARLQAELTVDKTPDHCCQGTLLSRAQYLVDVECLGYSDARVKPQGNMSDEEISIWTAPVREAAAQEGR